jgi:hypothetical protein
VKGQGGKEEGREIEGGREGGRESQGERKILQRHQCNSAKRAINLYNLSAPALSSKPSEHIIGPPRHRKAANNCASIMNTLIKITLIKIVSLSNLELLASNCLASIPFLVNI